MRNQRNANIAADALARYNRGEISKVQYLSQRKALLLEEKESWQRKHDEAEAKLASITVQISAIEAEESAC